MGIFILGLENFNLFFLHSSLPTFILYVLYFYMMQLLIHFSTLRAADSHAIGRTDKSSRPD